MYTMMDDEDKNLTKSFDLIFDGLEITTGGQRIHDYETHTLVYIFPSKLLVLPLCR